jgi:shikimate kinase
MKRTFILMTVLVAMITGVGTAMAFDLGMVVSVPEPTSMILVAAGLLGVAGISIRRKK